jgi:hypothetical protein
MTSYTEVGFARTVFGRDNGQSRHYLPPESMRVILSTRYPLLAARY